MCEKAHLTIANSDKSQVKTLPIKLISIVFFLSWFSAFFGDIKVWSWEKFLLLFSLGCLFICTVFLLPRQQSARDKDTRTITFLLLNIRKGIFFEREIKHWGTESFFGLILGKAEGWDLSCMAFISITLSLSISFSFYNVRLSA